MSLIVLTGVLTFSSQAFAAPPQALSYWNFENKGDLWQISARDIVVYSPTTNAIKQVRIDGFADNDTIKSAVMNDNFLWLATQQAIFTVDMVTSSITQVPFVRTEFSPGKLAVDLDYAWLACTDTLWRFDKLAQEWTGFALPQDAAVRQNPVGSVSINSEVYCVFAHGVYVFSAESEKWRLFALQNAHLGESSFFLDDVDALTILDNTVLYRFGYVSKQWDKTTIPAQIIDMAWDKTANYYLLSTNGVYSFSKTDGFVRKLAIDRLGSASTISKVNDTTIAIADSKQIIQYVVTNQSSDFVAYVPDRSGALRQKATSSGQILLLRCNDAVEQYDASSKLWVVSKLAASQKQKKFTWNQDEFSIKYAPGFESSLHGEATVQLPLKATYGPESSVPRYVNKTIYDTLAGTFRTVLVPVYDSTVLFVQPTPTFPTNLTLHTTLGKNRYIDGFFDNTNISAVPRKGLRYQGAPRDIIGSAQVLSNSFEPINTQTIRPVKFEGGSTALQSPGKLADRDRRIASGIAGIGVITTQTRFKHLTYNRGGQYNLTGDEETSIVPGSFRVWIDGEEVENKDFSFAAGTGDLIFLRGDRVDRTSTILVSYEVQTIPDNGFKKIELLPKNNFGRLAYMQTTVSPNSWLSMQTGYVYRQDSVRSDVINASVPLEFRESKPQFLLRCTPEFSYNATDQSKAGALLLDGRIGKRFSFNGNAIMADSAYRSTEGLSRGLGVLRNEIEAGAGYDIMPELPLSYKFNQRKSQLGAEASHRVLGGVQFQDFPKLDLEYLRTSISAKNEQDTGSAAPVVADSSRMSKDKVTISLYETASSLLQRAIHASKVGYELSYSQYWFMDSTKNERGYGRSFYGSANISPVNAFGIKTTGTYIFDQISTAYRLTLNLQAADLIKGIDLDGSYYIDYTQQELSDTTGFDQTRAVSLVIRPGTWIPFLNWISPRGGITQKSRFSADRRTKGPSIILLDDSLMDNTLKTTVGAHISIGSNLLLRNENTWTKSDSSVDFSTINDLKIFPLPGMPFQVWQTRYEFSTNSDNTNTRASTRLDQRWNRAMLTMLELGGTYRTTPAMTTLLLGPSLTLTLNAPDKWWIIRNLQNSHSIKTNFKNEAKVFTPWYETSYNFSLQINLAPNLLLSANSALSYNQAQFTQFSGTVFLKGIF